MKLKLNPLMFILGFFLFKMVVIDNYRFATNNSDGPGKTGKAAKKDVTLAAIR